MLCDHPANVGAAVEHIEEALEYASNDRAFLAMQKKIGDWARCVRA
jgi:hypothetical protein